MTKIIDVWDVYNTDGGGMGYHCGTVQWCSSEEKAIELKRGCAFYSMREHKAIEVDGKVYVLQSAVPIDLDAEDAKVKEKLKQAALDKLSETEKELLGLD